MRAFRYRLYPSEAQVRRLQETLGLCHELYNAGLQERRDAYRWEHKSIGYELSLSLSAACARSESPRAKP